MPVDCSGNWRARYGTSAYANGICTHYELTGEDPASYEDKVQEAASYGVSIKTFEEEGGVYASSKQPPGGSPGDGWGSAIGWGLGLGAIAAAWWYTSASKGR